MLQTALSYSHQLLQEVLQPGDIAVDATMGNGNDTLFMAEKVGPSGKVYSFDIQEAALAQTKERLPTARGESVASVQLICEDHERLDQLLPADEKIKACIFNLGYLPSGDKSIITLPETTKAALDATCRRLLPGGRIIVVSYYGHVGGVEELEMVQRYCTELPQEVYTVLRYQFVNQKNSPPILFCVERRA